MPADADRSLQLDPADPTALQQRGNALAGLNRLEEARDSFEAALKLSPNEAPTWNNLGAVHEQLGNTNAALQAFRHAIECTPPSRNAFISLACIQVRAGLYDEAQKSLDALEQQKGIPAAAAIAIRSALARRTGDASRANALEAQARALDSNAAAWALERISH